MDDYQIVNEVWPKDMPICTRPEAERAARKLMLHFGKRRSRWLRRCWIVLDQGRAGHLARGWRRMVHDVSHRVFAWDHPGAKKHGGLHARLELEMARYTIARGWLNGTLRPPAPTKGGRETYDQKLARIQARIRRWESKKKRAETTLAKIRRMERYYARKSVAAKSA